MKACLVFLLIAICINSLLHAKTPGLPRIRRNAYRDESRLWPNAIVPYIFQKKAFSAEEKKVIRSVMKDIKAVSCVRFKKHSYEPGYVEIVKGEGCRAHVGYSDDRRQMTLGTGCVSVGTVLHELFHVLGFFHEHARPDRDEYVRVLEDNIKPAHMFNYKKKSPKDVTTLGLPYDYSSILHYSDRGFAIDRSLRTFLRLIGERSGTNKALEMSKLDILKLNRLYHCPKKRMRM